MGLAVWPRPLQHSAGEIWAWLNDLACAHLGLPTVHHAHLTTPLCSVQCAPCFGARRADLTGPPPESPHLPPLGERTAPTSPPCTKYAACRPAQPPEPAQHCSTRTPHAHAPKGGTACCCQPPGGHVRACSCACVRAQVWR